MIAPPRTRLFKPPETVEFRFMDVVYRVRTEDFPVGASVFVPTLIKVRQFEAAVKSAGKRAGMRLEYARWIEDEMYGYRVWRTL